MVRELEYLHFEKSVRELDLFSWRRGSFRGI